MPQNLIESAAFTSPVQTVSNGDIGDASGFALAPQALANRTKYLNDGLNALAIGAWAGAGFARRKTVADVGSLKAITTAGVGAGDIVGVANAITGMIGEYRWMPTLGAGSEDIEGALYRPAALLIGDPGRWIRPDFDCYQAKSYTERHTMVQQSRLIAGAGVSTLGTVYARVSCGGTDYKQESMWNTSPALGGGPLISYGFTVRAVMECVPTSDPVITVALRAYDYLTPSTNYVLSERAVLITAASAYGQIHVEWSGLVDLAWGIANPCVEVIAKRSAHTCDIAGNSTLVVEGWRNLFHL